MTDAWDDIVGIDLDEWQRADSTEQVHWLAHLRDHPMPRQGRPTCTHDRIEVHEYGSRTVQTICTAGCNGEPRPVSSWV